MSNQQKTERLNRLLAILKQQHKLRQTALRWRLDGLLENPTSLIRLEKFCDQEDSLLATSEIKSEMSPKSESQLKEELCHLTPLSGLETRSGTEQFELPQVKRPRL